MAISRNRLGALALVAGVILLAAGPSRAQNAALPCDAFARTPHGGWRVLGPVMLDLNGRLYSPTVGTTFGAGATHNGVEVSDELDRHCGNR